MRMLSTPITLVILLAVLAVGAVWGYKAMTAKVAGPPPVACVTMPMTELATSSVTVNVLNGGDLRGLASRVADSLRQGGFIIGTVGNTTEKVLTVIIVGSSVDSPEVQLVSAWFAGAEVQADDRPDHSVDVLIGNSYDEATAITPDAPTTLEISTGQVCLPPTVTPTPTTADTAAAQPSDQPT